MMSDTVNQVATSGVLASSAKMVKIADYKAWLYMNDNFSIALTKKPNFMHRFFIKLFFGWDVKTTSPFTTSTSSRQQLNG
jgi:hypothetical protein